MRRKARNDRPYLEIRTRLAVRFHEVDSMGVVWHGHYAAYFEEARRVFGVRHGVDYPGLVARGLAAPVVKLWVDYLAPVRLADEVDVVARLFRSESAKLEFGYEIRCGPRLLAEGGTVQVFTSPDGAMLLARPPFLTDLYRQWEPLWIRP